MLKEHLNELNLPPLMKFANGSAVIAENFGQRRLELIDALCQHEFGYMPSQPDEVRVAFDFINEKAYCGKASEKRIRLSFDTPAGEFSFPVYYIAPKLNKKVPAIVHIAFSPDAPSPYVPVEEIIDRGFALAMFCHNDVSADTDDGFSTGIATMYGERTPASWGKIAMWAFAASRVADYLTTLPEIDSENLAVMGHSRLGKTALWAGANDERFKYVISNDSGCSGASIARESELHGDAEMVKRISSVLSYWFSGDYKSYGDRVNEMPFDQHWLLAASAPRYLYVASASEDAWACPVAEYLGCMAASPAWEAFSLDGFIAPDMPPKTNDTFTEGHIGYHLRPGMHFLSRYDWNKYMDFIESKI